MSNYCYTQSERGNEESEGERESESDSELSCCYLDRKKYIVLNIIAYRVLTYCRLRQQFIVKKSKEEEKNII